MLQLFQERRKGRCLSFGFFPLHFLVFCLVTILGFFFTRWVRKRFNLTLPIEERTIRACFFFVGEKRKKENWGKGEREKGKKRRGEEVS